MIGLICTFIVAASAPVPYTELNINDLHISSINTLNGKSSLNVEQIDLDQDGLIDLVFPDRILLQRVGIYTEDQSVPLPLREQGPAIDFHGKTVYLRFPDSLKTFSLEDETWVPSLDIEMTWTHLPARQPSETTESISLPRFEQFVYDIDGDNVPELLFPLQDGLHIYTFKNNRYVPTLPLNIFPRSKLVPLEIDQSQGGLKRYVTFPDQHMTFQCLVEDKTLTILTRNSQSPESIQYETTTYAVSRDNDQYHAEIVDTPQTSPTLPSHMLPVFLAKNEPLAYTGGALDYASSLAILTPIHVTTLKQADSPIQRFRTKSFVPHTLFTDVDHDGRLDLILENTDITNGGLRQTLARFTTQRRFKHTVNVHLNDANEGFRSEPDRTKTVTIRLDETPIRLSTMFERYQAGKLVNATGDFNGDKINDLVVQTRIDTLSLYLSTPTGYESDPSTQIPIEEFETFHIHDVNQDGTADILFEGVPIDEIQTRPPTRVLLFGISGDEQ